MKRLLALAAFASAFAVPAGADAAVTCLYESSGEVLDVTMSAEFDVVELNVSSGNIAVRSHGTPIACSGGSPTLANSEYIDVFANQDRQQIAIQNAAAFAPTTTFLLALGKATDQLSPAGSNGADHFILGESGIDTDADGSYDIAYLGSKPAEIETAMLEGPDIASARGGSGTGAAVSSTRLLMTGGGADNDVLEGGEASDMIEVGEGVDTAKGFGGDDSILVHGTGVHTIDGGEGEDSLSYQFAKSVHLDLGQTGPQNTGQGEETITGIEDVESGPGNDTLIGDDGPNKLSGAFGNDTIEGAGGNDTLNGSVGTDTLSYAKAPSGVEVDMSAKTVTGGAGKDSIDQFENLVGSSHTDTLTATSGPNEIDPGGGKDLVKALAGDDLVKARDGAADDVSCGDGLDKAIADRLSLDTIHPDCETVEALAEPGGGEGGKLDFRLSAPKKQKVIAQHGVKVKVRCPVDLCAIVAKVKGTAPKLGSKPVHKNVLAGPAKNLKLKLGGKALTALRTALAAGRTPKLKVTATATAGSAAPVTHTVTVKVKG